MSRAGPSGPALSVSVAEAHHKGARSGRKWRTFKQLRTDDNGAFRGEYRFTQTRDLQRYAFRALLKRQGDYPYEPGASHRRKLLVHG